MVRYENALKGARIYLKLAQVLRSKYYLKQAKDSLKLAYDIKKDIEQNETMIYKMVA